MECYFDGSITKNPGGFARCGWVIEYNGQNLHMKVELGEGEDMTNNYAEWKGLYELLLGITLLNPKPINEPIYIYGDSQLVIYGITGKWKVKKPCLHQIAEQCSKLLCKLKQENNCKITIGWKRREFNKADEHTRTYKDIDLSWI